MRSLHQKMYMCVYKVDLSPDLPPTQVQWHVTIKRDRPLDSKLMIIVSPCLLENSLCRGIIKLVFPRPSHALLDAPVIPKPPHVIHKLRREADFIRLRQNEHLTSVLLKRERGREERKEEGRRGYYLATLYTCIQMHIHTYTQVLCICEIHVPYMSIPQCLTSPSKLTPHPPQPFRFE